MAKKQRPRPAFGSATEPARPKISSSPPISIKKSLPPDALKRMREFYEVNREIEIKIWRSING